MACRKVSLTLPNECPEFLFRPAALQDNLTSLPKVREHFHSS